MKPDLSTLQSRCPDVDERLLREHLTRLGAEYFDRFDLEEITRHVTALARLAPDHPVELLIQRSASGDVLCTVLAFDYAFEFSAITGVLASMGFSVLSGDIFTYERPTEPPESSRRAYGTDRRKATDLLRRRRIIDCFSGTLSAVVSFEVWATELRRRMTEVLRLFERGDEDSVAEAKRRVNEWVTEHLADVRRAALPVLYPVQIRIELDRGPFTRLAIESQDTPAFLYSLSTALSLHGVSIEKVRIRTIHGRIEDEIDFVDLAGQPVRDPALLDRIKLSVLFTKQFTYFLDQAPDPYTALSRFEQLIQDTSQIPEGSRWLDTLSDPRAMQDLARLLGTSDYLWEDFIRLQYETLLPILRPRTEGRRFSKTPETLRDELQGALRRATTYEEKKRRLNEFKDREIFLIDLDHILAPTPDFAVLSERLTILAEQVVRAATETVFEHLVALHGRPLTVAGLEATFAVLGLGKFGGAALGYASDIELLFVYSDNGRTDGPGPIGNDEFFAALARETALFIEAKREGIFHVDLRLRPHGQAGPLACSLESFCQYYGPGGPAHSYERLALVRLRAVGGDPALGARIERLRDEFVYASSGAIQLKDLQDLRTRQFGEKTRPGSYNAKFSPGALVDLEYTVQILQVLYAKESPALRTPRMSEALEALRAARVLDPAEADRLSAAYHFLRRLINGLRMLRGSAQDLFLPPVDSEEFVHLARRMGYQRSEQTGALSPAQQLFVDFETQTAAVRAFVQRHFGRVSLPDPALGNVADLLLSDEIPSTLQRQILSRAGFRNTEQAGINLRRLAGEGPRRDRFVRLAVLACDMLRRQPDPDMALNNWELFTGVLSDPSEHYPLLLSQPRRLELMLAIFSRSQYLANTLIRHPDFFDWVTTPENLHAPLRREDLEAELRSLQQAAPSAEEWLRALRRFRQRQMLRIGTRDMCLHADTRDILLDLSTLAEAILQVALERVWKDLEAEGRLPASTADLSQRFCLLAFGKLGGRELNYSSDVDLLGVYWETGEGETGAYEGAPFAEVMDRLRSDLSARSEEGHVFRVDLRLRPYGTAGTLVSPLGTIENYYRESASLWEIQALLKLRPVAGNRAVGARLLTRLQPVLSARREPRDIARSIFKMRNSAVQAHGARLEHATDVKSGLGGIREVEFLVQAFQLMHAADHPEILVPGTLQALGELAEANLLPEDVAMQLVDDYLFLRRVEHYLQILEDRQIHALPTQPQELLALAKRMLGPEAQASDFTQRLQTCLQRVHGLYAAQLSRHLYPG